MDATDTCPYAVLAPAAGALLCYDLDLRYLGRHELPLDEIGYPKVTFDGVRYTLWLFGRRYRKPPRAAKSFAEANRAPLAAAEGYGIRYRPRDRSVEPIPISRGELLAALRRRAHGPDGERLEIADRGIAVSPFRDPDTDEGFWVLIEARAADEATSRTVRSGTRGFFRARLDAGGLGRLEQLPLWIVQEERDEALLDEDHGVLRFPRFLREEDVQAYSLGKSDLALWLQLAYARPAEDGTLPRSFPVLQTVAVFRGTGRPPRFLDLDLESARVRRWTRELSSDRLRVRPVMLADRVGRSTFALRAVCTPRRGTRFPCLVLMELEY